MNLKENFKPAAAIFDMDGLMLDTETPIIPLWIEAGKIIGWDIKEETAIRTIGYNGKDIREICYRDLGADFPFDLFLVELKKLVYSEFEKGIAHKKGLLPLLDHLASLSIPLAVATSTSRDTAVFKLEKTGILNRFTVIVCGNEVAHGKPAPDIFLKAAEKLGVPPEQCIGLEDSPAGLKALAAAGIPSIFIKDIIEPPEDVLATVWKRCNDLLEVIQII